MNKKYLAGFIAGKKAAQSEPANSGRSYHHVNDAVTPAYLRGYYAGFGTVPTELNLMRKSTIEFYATGTKPKSIRNIWSPLDE